MILDIEEILDKDLDNKVVVVETDTVYGIGALVNSVEAVKRIFEIKHRDQKKPMAVLVSNYNQVETLVEDLAIHKDLVCKYWPGAVTFIFTKKQTVSDVITCGLQTVGIRMPNSDNLLRIIEKFGPMVMTSLNESTEPAILKYSDAVKYDKLVDYLVKGDNLSDIPSTVYDLKTGKTLRDGKIKIE